LRKKYSITLEVRRKKKEKNSPLPPVSKAGNFPSKFPQKLAHEMRSD